ncbi:MAG: heat-inducible transcriptional repressor HrcA [Elusimicrobiota bacterium]
MRVLKPEVARQRKENILSWVVHKYVTTGRPISSESIFEGGNFNLSPATIRNILKELEEEGYLNQIHTSGGRVPSDKGYRAYVNSLMAMQNMAEAEKSRLELEYDRRMEQLDYFLKNTSRVLADISKMAGFAIFSDISQETLKRLDIVKISNKNYLSIIVTDANIIKHIPFGLEKNIEKSKLRAIVSDLNERLKGVKIQEIKKILAGTKSSDEAEKEIYRAVIKVMEELQKQDDSLYLEGLSAIFSGADQYDYEDMVNVARLLEEKEKFSAVLKEKLKEASSHRQLVSDNKLQPRRNVEVTIGSESSLKEFKNFSMVSSSYCIKDKAVGLVGVIGYKRMEYPKVISIVDSVSAMIEEALSQWETFDDEEF